MCLWFSIFFIDYVVTVFPDGVTQMTQTLDWQWSGRTLASFADPRGFLLSFAQFSNNPEASHGLKFVPVTPGTTVRNVQTFHFPAALGTLESIPTLDDVVQIRWVDWADFGATHTVCSPFGPFLAGDPECFER